MTGAGDPLAVNRARWDELARLHGQDAYYDTAGFLAGSSALTDREVAQVQAAVGDVAGLRMLHLQCHFGLDTLSWARRGAVVTGLDFSPVAVAKARALAREAGLDATFVEGDAQQLPPELQESFDVVFASYGVLCWIPDVTAWMRSAAAALCRGGHLVLLDLHPLFTMLSSREPLDADFPYLGAEPMHFSVPGSYADLQAATTSNETVQYAHGLGEVTTAAAAAGLRVQALTEWLDEEFDPRGDMLVPGADGRYQLPLGPMALPVTYALRATKD